MAGTSRLRHQQPPPARLHAAIVGPAGLAGVVGEAGGLLVLDRDRVIEAADRLGLFVYGAEAD